MKPFQDALWLKICALLLLICLGVASSYLWQVKALREDYYASLRMLDATLQRDTQVQLREHGYLVAYYNGPKDYYCVSTYKRSAEEISISEVHESCHSLVKVDYAHFCVLE